MSEETQRIIAKIEPVLRKHGVLRSSLFGSFARGEQTPESDVDVLVELPKGSSLFDLIGLKHDLEDLLEKKVDVITYRSIYPRLRPYIERDMIPVYG